MKTDTEWAKEIESEVINGSPETRLKLIRAIQSNAILECAGVASCWSVDGTSPESKIALTQLSDVLRGFSKDVLVTVETSPVKLFL